jgi:uncharacterized membrane protein YhaH (DUF805 family)
MQRKSQFWMALLIVAVVILGAVVLALRVANTADAASQSQHLTLLITSLTAS